MKVVIMGGTEESPTKGHLHPKLVDIIYILVSTNHELPGARDCTTKCEVKDCFALLPIELIWLDI
jgi:hypothetical protein